MNAHETPPHRDLEARVTIMEDRFDRFIEEMREFRLEMREFQHETRREFHAIRQKMDTDFRILFGAIIASDVALAGLIAHVARWV